MLSRIALRYATVAALKGRTVVGDNVLDSQIGALDVTADGSLRTDEDRPFIAVYTDNSVTSGPEQFVDARALHRAGHTDLIIEAGVTSLMTETDPDTGVQTIVGAGIPATDSALEYHLDIICRQVMNALSDPSSEWAEMWRDLFHEVVKVEHKRTADAQTGTRIAAHQIVMTVDLRTDPVFGEPIADGGTWGRFFALMGTMTDNVSAAKRAEMLNLVGSAANDSDAIRRRYGLTLAELQAMYLGPVATGSDGNAVPITQVTTDAGLG